MRSLLGWSAQGTAWGIRAVSVPLGNLHAGEFVLFISHISTGLGLPISSFFLLLLEDFGLQLQHLTPHSILLTAIFVHLCEMNSTNSPTCRLPRRTELARIPQAVSYALHPSRWRTVLSSSSVWNRRG